MNRGPSSAIDVAEAALESRPDDVMHAPSEAPGQSASASASHVLACIAPYRHIPYRSLGGARGVVRNLWDLARQCNALAGFNPLRRNWLLCVSL